MTHFKPHARQNRIDLTQLGEAGLIAVLVTDGFDATDLTDITSASERAGYRTVLLSPNASLVSGRSNQGEEMNFVVDAAPGDKAIESFAGLLVPAGAQSVATLIDNQDARLLIGDFVRSGKPVCALGEAVGALAQLSEADKVEGDAALALKGQVFTASGEDARSDARAMFLKSLEMVEQAA